MWPLTLICGIAMSLGFFGKMFYVTFIDPGKETIS